MNGLPSAFVLSDAAQYAFKCQDVYPDVVSFASAIPEHLRPIFLTPVQVQYASSRVAIAIRVSEGAGPTGATPEGELFSYQTFKYEDNTPNIPSSDPGSIFEIDTPIDKTHHQEYNFDQNIQTPTDTTFNTDVDTTQYTTYPYRTPEKPVRRSSTNPAPVVVVRLAYKESYLKTKAPKNIRENSKKVKVSLISFEPRSHIFTFNCDTDGSKNTVQAALSDRMDVSLNCSCKFWRYNGPEHKASRKRYLLAPAYGQAYPPDIRDPEGKYWLCKHTLAVLKRLSKFVDQVSMENAQKDNEDLVEIVEAQWDRMEPIAEIPDEDLSENEVEVETDWDKVPEAKYEKMAISSTLLDLSDW